MFKYQSNLSERSVKKKAVLQYTYAGAGGNDV
jgi:hypothetical protein